jgi:hypothetical protein
LVFFLGSSSSPVIASGPSLAMDSHTSFSSCCCFSNEFILLDSDDVFLFVMVDSSTLSRNSFFDLVFGLGFSTSSFGEESSASSSSSFFFFGGAFFLAFFFGMDLEG